MLVIIKKGFKEVDRNGNTIIDIPPGFKFNSIRYKYIPKDIVNKWSDYRKELVQNEKMFVLYYKGFWILINEEDCEVPICTQWGYNL